ncbi:tyrosine--tRNA ligase 1, cytoplasmic isoform X2 [Sorghum bicolor]|uniref:tyrosine--tRNA ligase 1, cytoplasmic isoform X2 n=1 Tax=Sorghum bicolor TaxID=4558 RepID=UPI000B423F39|nr:tyrosine--tRNA ligase 1, cytoplasmic isoform X2 [Sorghum bicolor]|eukprot:XP_002454296.2 tyrosine--tRNA ligase 1, cytoplasmic isoform X2 [Sorghum bicolor]
MDNSAVSAMDLYRHTRGMSLVDRFTVLTNTGDECIREVELWFLLKRKTTPVCYVWFEPSPKMSIDEGIMKTIYVNKIVKAGCTVKILMADLFAVCYKSGSYNLDQVRTIGSYNIEMWRAAGMDLERVQPVWLSDELNHHPSDYWPLALDISTKSTVDQMARCRVDLESFGPEILSGAELFYPCLQIAVILVQKTALSYKMKRVFCPPNLTLGNPCLDYIKHVIFPWFGKLEVVHTEGKDGNRTFASMEELILGYESGVVDSANVKLAFEMALNKILQPVHDHFRDNSRAMALFSSLKKYKRGRRQA